jgi:hypothetical protein
MVRLSFALIAQKVSLEELSKSVSFVVYNKTHDAGWSSIHFVVYIMIYLIYT